jgi:hypothetical protein
MSKENIYDEQISPLMQQIIAISREHKIALFFSARLEDEDGDQLYCTTHLPGDDDVHHDKFNQCALIIRPPSQPTMQITTTHADGSKTLTAFI